MGLKDIVAGLFSPVADIFKAREARKAAKEAAAAKLAMATAEGRGTRHARTCWHLEG
jgi:hypothetical protein